MKKTLLLFLVLLISILLYSTTFTDIDAGLTGLSTSASEWGDFDNDGDLDLIISGNSIGSLPKTRIYRNDGSTFTLYADLQGLTNSAVAWGDYDNDGDLDILLNGENQGSFYSIIYRNDDDHSFSNINAPLLGLAEGSVSWVDYDNDGDLDVFISGNSNIYYSSKIYNNDGNDIFTDINAPIIGLRDSSSDWGDYDNDGDLDLLLTGQNGVILGGAFIYRNNGNGSFANIDAELQGVYGGNAKWGDYDNDGYLDIVLAGYYYDIQSLLEFGKVYHNSGNSSFSESAVLIGLGNSSVDWGDYDNDGDLDILYSGRVYNSNTKYTKVYRNDSNGIFTDVIMSIPDIAYGSVKWGDYDNDMDLDLIITGTSSSGFVSKIYRNDGTSPNTKPSVPSNLRLSILDGYTVFEWDASNDAQTPSEGLNYILKIGSTPGGIDILSPMSGDNGYRFVPCKGFANTNCSWKIKTSCLPDSFFWKVQAIDKSFSGSYFGPAFPEITNLGSSNINFGNVPIFDISNEVEVRIKNCGGNDLTVNSVHFTDGNTVFSYNYTGLGNLIQVNEIDTIFIHFTPNSVGSFADTIYVESNAVNNPVLKIRLMGTGTYVPPKLPENLVITQIGDNMQLNWDIVTQDIHNNPITVDGYIVLYNESPSDENSYWFLTFTPALTYTHQFVARFRDQMFYHVLAYKDYGRGNLERLAALNGIKKKLRYQDLSIDY